MNTLNKGFTLLEILLVLIIASTIMGLLITYTAQTSDQNLRNKEVVQIQQILNAAVSYYIQNGNWPGTATWVYLDKDHALVTGNFLPKGNGTNGMWMGAYLQNYQTGYDTATGNFYVINSLPTTSKSAPANATIIAGQIPLGVTATANGTQPPVTAAKCLTTAGSSCYVVGRVLPPGQSLATARSVNFGNVYHHGACVPAPVCPDATHYAPEILVAATQVSGNSDATNPASTFPITSFYAYAYGQANGTSQPSSSPSSPTTVADCEAPASARACASSCTNASTGACTNSLDATRKYWRVCVLVQTSSGQVNNASNSKWAQNSLIMAVTRCAPIQEQSGSDFTVWTP